MITVYPMLAVHLWQSTLFGVVLGLLTLLLRKNPARTRYWVWLAALMKFLVPFGVLVSLGGYLGMSGWGPKAPLMVQPAISFVMGDMNESTLPVLKEELPAPQPTNSRWPAILFGMWACGFIAITFRWLQRWIRVRTDVRAARPLPFEIGIPIVSSPVQREPGVFGVFRPVLILPDGMAEQLSKGEWDAILAHELCHARCYDNLTAAIYMLVETIFWFHPVVWWMGKRLVFERELACDEEVLRLGSEPKVYAEGILKVCELYLESPLECMAGVAGSNLRRRIRAIMTNRRIERMNMGKKLILVTLGVAALAAPIVVGVLSAPFLLAQALPTSATAGSTPRLEFEVASIRPAGPMNLPGVGGVSEKGGIPGVCRQRLMLDQGRLDIRCYSLGKLMWAWAFGIPPTRLVGTAWMGDSASDWSSGPKFDISAKLPEGTSKDEVPAMLQNLLTTRFKLATHREYREQPVYALVAAKGGLTAPPASQNADTLNAPATPQATEPMNMNGVSFYGARVANPDGGGPQIVIMNSSRMGTVRDSDSGSPKHIRRFEAPSITFGGLADLLTISGVGPEPVIDLTGQTGRYQVVLEMSMAEAEALLSAGTQDQTDLKSAQLKAARDGLKKLGLQLEQRKAPIEVLVVDHLEKAPSEN